ncbi:MAG: NADPH-dependent F420 reductase [Thermoproteota archaeon]|nr:NADPH-dependent F420 reductase [Candidatus Brockarchaeota archaeon]
MKNGLVMDERIENKGETIGLIGGTGHLGRGLALRWAKKHKVIIGSRDEEKAKRVAQEVTEKAIKEGLSISTIEGKSNDKTIEFSDVVVFCVDFEPALELLKTLKEKFSGGKIVISPVVNLKKRDNYFLPDLKGGKPSAVVIKENLPQEVHVVSALHTLPAGKLYSADPLPGYSVIVYGEGKAKEVVISLLREIEGIGVFDGGTLEVSFFSEYVTALLLNLARINKLKDLSLKIY